MTSPLSRRNLPLLLLRAREAVISHFRPILNHFGLTEQQWRIIRALEEQGDMEPWQISEHCQILKPSLTGVLSRMEELGLVRRRRVASDQRRFLVSSTPRGSELVRTMAPLVNRQYGNLERIIGTEMVEGLYRVLDRLLAGAHGEVKAVVLPGAARRARKSRRSPRHRPR
jgi:homoprotocatechuate degradation regulator HpaR